MLKIIRWPILLLLFSFLPSSLYAGTVKGIVVDSESKEPIAGATVVVGKEVALTDDNGRYSIANLPAGNYKVTANFAGALAEKNDVAVGADGTVEVALSVAMSSAGGETYEIAVSGLRGKPRSSTDSAVPIDTFNAEALRTVSNTDMNDVLQTLVPSFAIKRNAVLDGSTSIRAPSLRQLDSHHTLVLVNGKRRHRSALVQLTTSYGAGTGQHGPDLATIPTAAVESIEILRDGASSQYGSDAIAGVMNFNLKSNYTGFDLSFQAGRYYEGDGEDFTLSGNVGLPLGPKGFLSISGEINRAAVTDRSAPYCEDWFCEDTSSPIFSINSPDIQGFVRGTGTTPELTPYQEAFPAAFPAASKDSVNAQAWGQPAAAAARLFYNAGIKLADFIDLYSFGSYSDSKTETGFFYRDPFNSANGFVRRADGTLYSALNKYPGGFAPQFEGSVSDFSVVGGARGEIDFFKFKYDLSGRYGSDKISYRIYHTVNPSMGELSPTEFRPGALRNEELQFQADMSNEFCVGLASPLVFAYGGSFLDDKYNVLRSDDPNSYLSGTYSVADPYDLCTDGAVATSVPTAAGLAAGLTNAQCQNASDPVYQTLGVGSNGFQGYDPTYASGNKRQSYAAYADLSTDIFDSLFVQTAGRYEYYSDFGSNFSVKGAGRFKLIDQLSIRGSVGTGFRAPTTGQLGTTNVSTNVIAGVLTASGTFPPDSAVAQALGATPLKPETSFSWTLGLTSEIDKLTLTADFYSIDIKDTMARNSVLAVSTDPGAGDAYNRYLALVAAGVAGAASIEAVQFFVNGFDKRNMGVDVVAAYPFKWSNESETKLQMAINWNQISFLTDASAFLSASDQFIYLNENPNLNLNFQAQHLIGDFSFLARGRFIGDFDIMSSALVATNFHSVFYVDLEAQYKFAKNWSLTVGGRNVANQYPQKTSFAANGITCCGQQYWDGSQDWQGGFYYSRLDLSF